MPMMTVADTHTMAMTRLIDRSCIFQV
jgi:hypothetical protein